PAYEDEMRRAIAAEDGFVAATNHAEADILILFEKTFFKTRRYLSALRTDRWVRTAAGRLFVINKDDFAHGLLPGLYTSLPESRSDPHRHRTICYCRTPNPLIVEAEEILDAPRYLASFRGNLKGHPVRRQMFRALQDDPRFALETTDSWLLHAVDEQ